MTTPAYPYPGVYTPATPGKGASYPGPTPAAPTPNVPNAVPGSQSQPDSGLNGQPTNSK
jgi:hypothetical protein